jgi:diaminopimelate epimerase
MRLSKHHGLGNDFLVLLDPEGITPVSPETVAAACDRRRGIGADGLIRMIPGTGGADVTMQLYNADGGVAEMSGNGIRCLAQAVFQAGLANPPLLHVMTDAGVRTVEVIARPERDTHLMRVDMGAATLGDEQPEWVEEDIVRAVRVDMGNPHLVLHAADLTQVPDITELGEAVNKATPGGINVEVITSGPEPGELTMLVYERGVGVTEACGTGACAAAVAAHAWELTGDKVVVHMPGGPVSVVVANPVLLEGPTTSVAIIDFPWP